MTNNGDASFALTRRAGVEGVVVDLVVGAPEREADAVLAVLDRVVVDVGAERLEHGDAGVGVVVHVVICVYSVFVVCLFVCFHQERQQDERKNTYAPNGITTQKCF